MVLIIPGQLGIYSVQYKKFLFFIICFDIRFGFAHVPTQPGFHKVEIVTWKIAPNSFLDSLQVRFNTGGYTVSKSDLVFTGIERYIFFLYFLLPFLTQFAFCIVDINYLQNLQEKFPLK